MPEDQRDDGDTADALTIHQMAARAGVPARRIRYYVAEGLIPSPVGRGRAAHYTNEHLDRLRQILALRHGNLSLDEIRQRLGESPRGQARRSNPREAEQWRRWEVAPGVEIHAREDLDATRLATVRVLVGVAHHILSDPDSSDANEGTSSDS